MNFAIKTSSISKKKFRNGNIRSANQLTPVKKNKYIKKLEGKVLVLESENCMLRKEVDFLKDRLKKSYNRNMSRSFKSRRYNYDHNGHKIPLKDSTGKLCNEGIFENSSEKHLSNTEKLELQRSKSDPYSMNRG